MKKTAIVLFALSMAACASMPVSTLYNLWNFDPWSSDFREWRAAARMPATASPTSTPHIVMTIGTKHDGDAQAVEQIFILRPSLEPRDLTPLSAEQRPGYIVVAYRLDPKDFARLDTLRGTILASKKSGARPIHGSLAIKAVSCGGIRSLPRGKFLVSTYLLVDRRDGYNPLMIDFDLTEAIRELPAAEKKDGC